MAANRVLVVGGTGKTGRRVADRLSARGVPVRIGSRSAQPPFDWASPAGWEAVLRDVDAVYLTYFPDVAAPGAYEAIEAFLAAATKSAVGKVVLLSGRGEPEAERCEQLVRHSGLEWTIVRASWFAQNFSEGYLLDGVMAGEIALPAGEVGEPFVDADDIAEVAVAALMDSRHAGQLYEVTGPRLLTFADAVAEIASATGRPIQYRPITVDAFAAGAREVGVPEEFVSLLSYLFGEVLDGRNASLSDGVVRALDRAPRDFTEYARDAEAAGAWTPRG
jgi:uncharacterized protein YbjT (DUF2867 family)